MYVHTCACMYIIIHTYTLSNHMYDTISNDTMYNHDNNKHTVKHEMFGNIIWFGFSGEVFAPSM